MALHHRIQQPELDPVPIAHMMKDEIDDKCSDPCVKHCHHDCMHPSPSHNTLLIPPSPKSNHHISKPLIFMFCTIGLAFFFIFYITTRFQMLRHNSRRRNQRALDHDDVDGSDSGSDENHLPVIDHPIWLINTPGLNQSVIDSITVIKYKREERLVEGSDCLVCLGEFQEDESLRLLPKCSHAFHIPCIDTWLRSHTNCPLCRAPIVCDATNSTHVNVNSNGQLESTRMETSESYGAELGSTHQRGDNGASHRERLRDGSFVPLSSEHSTIANILENNSRCFNARNCELRVLSDLAEHLAKVEENLQPVRRSISMDSSSASMVYFVMASMTQPSQTEGCSDNGLVQIQKPNLNLESKKKNGSLSMHRLIKSSSFKRLHKGPVSMKRSFSASGKWFLPRYNSRSQDSILPF